MNSALFQHRVRTLLILYISALVLCDEAFGSDIGRWNQAFSTGAVVRVTFTVEREDAVAGLRERASSNTVTIGRGMFAGVMIPLDGSESGARLTSFQYESNYVVQAFGEGRGVSTEYVQGPSADPFGRNLKSLIEARKQTTYAVLNGGVFVNPDQIIWDNSTTFRTLTDSRNLRMTGKCQYDVFGRITSLKWLIYAGRAVGDFYSNITYKEDGPDSIPLEIRIFKMGKPFLRYHVFSFEKVNMPDISLESLKQAALVGTPTGRRQVFTNNLSLVFDAAGQLIASRPQEALRPGATREDESRPAIFGFSIVVLALTILACLFYYKRNQINKKGINTYANQANA
jgi:hypothetical protein